MMEASTAYRTLNPGKPDTHRLTEMASQEVGCLDTLGTETGTRLVDSAATI